MRNHRCEHRLSALRLPGPLLILCICSALSGCMTADGAASTAVRTRDDFERDKAAAHDLVFVEHKTADALQILEKLAVEDAEDRDVNEMLAVCLTAYAPAMAADAAGKQRALIRAREAAQKAKEKGATNPLLDFILESVPADGKTTAAFSADAAADAAMTLGEAYFAKNDYQKALEAYMSAEALDPMLYYAPLYIGDCYFLMKRPDMAGQAFARAVATNPDLETAYRYWGDSLMSAGKMEEALEKFIDAVIAEPYTRLPWRGIDQWAERNGKQIGHFTADIPITVAGAEITLDERMTKDDPTSALWLLYALKRTQWFGELFSKAHPEEKQYRHSLAEECDSIRAMILLAKEMTEKGTLTPEEYDPTIRLLMELDEKGCLESYVLFALADEGIAKDYPAYRAGHRGNLRSYLAGWAVHDK